MSSSEDRSTLYRAGVDFSALASVDGDFATVDPRATQQLTRSLLKRDFGLSIDLPNDRLCPPVPNRLNYVIWIQRLLDTTNISLFLERIKFDGTKALSSGIENNATIFGLDIGTGASSIYPLLGCVLRKNWIFFGTDIDQKNIQFAQRNVVLNNLENRIKIIKMEPHEPLIPFDKLGLQCIDFCMCNPPFYESKEDIFKSAEAKKKPPFTACTGAEVEMVTEGGEVAFISRLIDESLRLKNRIHWYSSMLEFVQGNKTRRWAIAWSFDDLRPTVEIARGLKSLPRSLLPFPSQYRFMLKISKVSEIVEKLDAILSPLPLIWQWERESLTGNGASNKNVWSRAVRRQRTTHGQEKDEGIVQNGISFGFEIKVNKCPNITDCHEVIIRWIKGHDATLFESFCGMIRRNCCN